MMDGWQKISVCLIAVAAFGAGWAFGEQSQKKAGATMGNDHSLNARHRKSDKGRPLGGLTTGPGLEIHWRGDEQPNGAEPIDLIAAAANRLEHLQTETAEGGNETAKLLWEAQECLRKMREVVDGKSPARPTGNGLGAGLGGNVDKPTN